MTAFEGMDTGAIRRIASQLNGQADAVAAVITSVTGLVDHATGVWQGSDAHDFANWWTSQHRPRLQAAHDALRGLGQSAANNADAQGHVSGTGTVSHATPTPPSGPGPTAPGAGSTFTAADFKGAGPEFSAAWNTSGTWDQWGFSPPNPDYPGTGDCTSFVAWRLNELAAAKGLNWSFTNGHVPGHSNITQMGYAYQWGHQDGLPHDQTPQVGAVAWFDKSDAPGMTDGHVAIVRAIQPDHGVVIEESGYAVTPNSGFLYKTEVVYPNTAGYPSGFLHLLPGS